MARRLLPAVLALVALLSDLAGAHGLAFAALLAAIPSAFVLALDCYGDALAARCGGSRPLLTGLSLALLVLSAALRSPAVVGGVPRLAVSLTGLCVLLYAGAAATALQPARTRPHARTRPAVEPARDERRAA